MQTKTRNLQIKKTRRTQKETWTETGFGNRFCKKLETQQMLHSSNNSKTKKTNQNERIGPINSGTTERNEQNKQNKFVLNSKGTRKKERKSRRPNEGDGLGLCVLFDLFEEKKKDWGGLKE